MPWVKTDLGLLSGGNFSFANGASSDGSIIVGQADTGSSGGLSHAFIWTSSGGMVDLGIMDGTYSIASDVSDDGTVISGTVDHADSSSSAMVWKSGTGMVALPTLSGGQLSGALAISNDGSTILGFSSKIPTITITPVVAVYWKVSDLSVHEIGLYSTNVDGTSTCSNIDGTIIAGGSDSLGDVPWIWNGAFTGIPLPSGDTVGQMRGLSNDGSKGCGSITSGPDKGFYWSGGISTAIPLTPYDISGDGTKIVGVSSNTPAYWDNSGIIILPGGNGFAYKISNDGSTIIGHSGNNAAYWSYIPSVSTQISYTLIY